MTRLFTLYRAVLKFINNKSLDFGFIKNLNKKEQIDNLNLNDLESNNLLALISQMINNDII